MALEISTWVGTVVNALFGKLLHEAELHGEIPCAGGAFVDPSTSEMPRPTWDLSYRVLNALAAIICYALVVFSVGAVPSAQRDLILVF